MGTPTEYDWDAHWRTGGQGAPSRAQREAALLVLRHSPDRVARVADLGSGAGVVACLVARALPAVTIVGIDASSESSAHATERAAAEGLTNVSFSTARAEALPFENELFDLVYSDQLLQYTDEPSVLREVARVLRPGGRAILIAPNASNVVFAATALIAGDRHGSRRVYTRHRLRSLARAAGLRVLGWDGYLPAYPVQRLGYFYAPWVAPIGTLAERLSDRIDSRTARGLSRRFGFSTALVAERVYQ
jgi:SAM-dependent methyltransferase